MTTVSATPRPGSGIAQVLRGIARSPSASVGFTLVAIQVLLAIFAPLIVRDNPTRNDPDAILLAPSLRHLFGTDSLGRDIFARTLYGGRYALSVSFSATLLAVALGTLIACLAAYYGGWIDQVLMRVLDSILAVPAILALLVIVTVLGTGPIVIILAVVVVYTGGAARVIRAAAMDAVSRDYVTAARARGEKAPFVIAREVLPNIFDIVMVEFAMRASWVVLLISSLSFLGFGANPPTPDWGLMVAENRSLMSVVPLATVAPMVFLAALIVGLNLAADGLAKTLGVDRAREVR